MSDEQRNRLEALRGEAIKANCLIYAHTTFALIAHGSPNWKGFHCWNNLHRCWQ